MSKKNIGTPFSKDAEKWKQDPAFRRSVDEHKEKAKLAALLKEIREKEELSQHELARIAEVPQSVIARIEGANSKSLPRIDLFNRILASVGYKVTLTASSRSNVVRVAF